MKQFTYFISYTTRTENDIAWAKWVEWILRKKLNAETIMQEYDFGPGVNFRMEMDKALKRSDKVVCVLTRDYLESSNCAEEWSNALNKIIPIKFDSCEPSGLLTSRAYINLFGQDKDIAREMLIKAIYGAKRPEDEPDAPFAGTSSAAAPAKVPDVEAEPDLPVESGIAVNNLPNRNEYYTGREDMLGKIGNGLQHKGIVTIVGAGGFGKTQVALGYAYLHISDYKYIWYFNADSEARLQDDYREFARRNLNFDNAFESVFSIVNRMISYWFRDNDSYLLIYDNAEDCANLRKYLPDGHHHKHIIINSRERLHIVSEKIEIEVFSERDAIDFLKNRLHDVDDGSAASLAEELGCLPLALECAAAYIDENKYTFEDYVKKWKESKRKIALLRMPPNATEYDKTVLTTWLTTFEKINQEAEHNELTKAALQLFRLCIYCAPDNIPLQIFVDGREETPEPLRSALDPDNEQEDAIIGELTRYSLVSLRRNDGAAYLSMHRLMQEAAGQGFEQHKEWVGCCLNIAVFVFEFQFTSKDDFDKFTLYKQHILSIAQKFASYLLDNESKIKIAGIYNRVGMGLTHLNEYKEALLFYYMALKIFKKVLGMESAAIAMIYNNIASVYSMQCDHKKALKWSYLALAIKEKVLGTEHPDTATTYNTIAEIYKNQCNYKKAFYWNEKALVIHEKVLGLEHPNTARIYMSTASLYELTGDYHHALEMYNIALFVFMKNFGTEHSYISIVYSGIAHMYYVQGFYEKALEWYSEALIIIEKVMGMEHLETATIYNEIAVVYEKQGKYERARDLLCRAVIVMTMNKLADHQHTQSSINTMADCYIKAGGKEEDFEGWFQERKATYPCWCE